MISKEWDLGRREERVQFFTRRVELALEKYNTVPPPGHWRRAAREECARSHLWYPNIERLVNNEVDCARSASLADSRRPPPYQEKEC